VPGLPPTLLRDLVRRRPLTGRVVLVTGATAGVGRATALRLARGGAVVVGAARDAAELQRLQEQDGSIDVEVADIAEDGERADLVARVLERHGRVDALVQCVGIGWSGQFEDMEAAQVRRVVETNVIASIDLTRLVVRDQLRRADGDVVIVGSGASWFATPSLTVYSATKYAIEGFTEGARRELLPRGVRVHAVHPGLIATEFAARSAGDVPGDVPPDATQVAPGPGMSPDVVAAAVERVLVDPGVHDRAVPRVMGLTRVLKLPPLQQATDLVVGLGGPQIARLGRAVAERAAGLPRR
jgi:short-subunit dehydrogenase